MLGLSRPFVVKPADVLASWNAGSAAAWETNASPDCRRRATVPAGGACADSVRGVTDYQPLTAARLGVLLVGSDESRRWRLVAEFLEDYSWEPVEVRSGLLSEEPAPTGDVHWDVFLAALAEHVAAKDGRGAPPWAESRSLRQFWFPFNTRAARVDALVHAPAAFRRRGVFVAAQELNVA